MGMRKAINQSQFLKDYLEVVANGGTLKTLHKKYPSYCDLTIRRYVRLVIGSQENKLRRLK